MAKKVLTPEEFQAKLEKKTAKRNLFFGTFTKALAFFLAIAIAWSLAAIAFAPAIGGGTVVNGGAQTQQGGSESTGGNNDVVDFGGSSSGDSTSTPSGDSTSTPSGDSGVADTSKADAIKAVNDATAKVYKGNYKWERKCYFTSPIDVGGATDTLNGIIQGVDENASIDSVVGGFLGITGTKDDPAWSADVKGGKLPAEGKMNNEKYLMKAFALTEGDVMQYKVDGNKYMFQLNACNNPQKDGKNALNHVTNDFITLTEVQEGVAGALGAAGNLLKVESCDVDFTSIVVTAVIDGGNLKSVQISYSMNVKALNLKATLIPITGKGAGDMICTYSNFS